jgi:ATP-dependent Clp protease ATP-binding subunit ClpX
LKRSRSEADLTCSFCHKAQDVVGKLISSPSDYPRACICDECIVVCNSILEDDRPKHTAAAGTPLSQNLRQDLHFLLEQIRETDVPTVRKILQSLI